MKNAEDWFDFATNTWVRRDFLSKDAPVRTDFPPVAKWHGRPLDDSRPDDWTVVLTNVFFACLLTFALPKLIVLSVSYLAWILYSQLTRRRRKAIDIAFSLLESEPSGTSQVVRFSLYKSLCLQWSDYGVLILEADRMIFVGLATSFVLGGQDVGSGLVLTHVPAVELGSPVTGEFSVFAIHFREGSIHGAIDFVRRGGQSKDMNDAMQAGINRFVTSQRSSSDERSLPPVKVPPTK